ncbi:lamin tail domain-containing protein [Lysobacter sp. K5869]|uniref:lamin tail domain-containing protein n=1 Tax=Lysobacter sp. K5869 TaxID=2820808 RepID=UPI001C06023C|nr:lamin tail domain-containing protein [Lysobacter sp. K5869]QWP78488.1 lamin tail domain-containing protein [Lysobacter sp. K5869]
MHSLASRALAAGIALALAGTARAEIVVSQIYAGAGSPTASPYRGNYIELHNTGGDAVALDAWSLQSNPTNTAGNWLRSSLRGSIAPGGYYLIATGNPSAGRAPLPTPDLQVPWSLNNTGGRVAVVSENRTLSGQCPTGARDRVVYGSVARCGTAPALAAPARDALLRGDEGCRDTDIDSADFAVGAPAPRSSQSPARACGPLPPLALSVADIAQAEGDSNRTAFVFTVKLNRAAPAGGVTFRFNTNPGSALAGQDFDPIAPINGTIAEGAVSTTVAVAVLGDRIVEADETFELHMQAVTPGVTTDADGVLKAKATILNDDVPILPIGAVQGRGAQSPMLGQAASVIGVVTAAVADGLFVQNDGPDADGDPATSDALFVQTGQAGDPALVGQRVRVSGTVLEYAPDPATPAATLTALGGSPTVETLGAASLPALQWLGVLPPDPTQELERVEGMRVRLSSDLRVVGPTGGRIVAGQDTTISDGVFHVVSMPMTAPMPARPQREPGLRVRPQNPNDSANAPLLPLWDGNPEVIAIDSSTSGAGPLQVASEAKLRDAGGVLSLRNGRYTLLMSGDGKPTTTAPGVAPRGADEDRDGAPDSAPLPPLPADRALSVAYYDLERLFDVQDDPRYADEVPTAAAYERNLRKAALGILRSLGAPDLVALGGVEGNALQNLSMRIDALASEAGEPLPHYQFYTFEGRDPRGLNLAFLYKTGTEQSAGLPRVDHVNVQPIGANVAWEGSGPLYTHPPLALDATVHLADGGSVPLTAVLVGMDGRADSESVPANADPGVEGVRVRRQRQAEFLAGYLNQRQNQTFNGAKPQLLVLGDFDDFAFSDGYVDTVNAIAGTPGPDLSTSVPDGQDWVQPDLIQADSLNDAQRRYSSVEQGNAQSTRHALLSEEFVLASDQVRVQHARINADFPAILHDDASTPARAASSDPLRISWVSRVRAELSVQVESADAASVALGERLRYRAALRNDGPGAARSVAIAFASSTPDGDLHVTPPSPQWTCSAPTVSDNATSVACTAPSLPANVSDLFEIDAPTAAGMVGWSIPLAASVSAQSYDADSSNDRAVGYQQVTPPADPGAGGAPTP